MRAKLRNKVECFLVHVVFACHYAQWRSDWRLCLHSYCPRNLLAFAFESAQTLCAPISDFLRGRIDHAQHGFAVLYQCDVDSEVAAAGDEFFCAIQRIEQPKLADCFAGCVAGFVFFRDHQDIRRQSIQARDDDAVRG